MIKLEVQFCISCGTPSTPKPKYNFSQPKETYLCKTCAYKYRKNIKEIRFCIICGKPSTLKLPSYFSQPKETYKCSRCANQNTAQNPLWKENNLKAIYKTRLTQQWKENNLNAIHKIIQTPQWIEKNKRLGESRIGTKLTDEQRIHQSMGHQGITDRTAWSGYATEQRYCDKWTTEFKERIRSFWKYTCGLSSKPEHDDLKLDCHHVYWKKSSCCIIEDESNKYHLIGDNKYYYNGNPDKFIPLTEFMHKTVTGNKEKSKIMWVKELEHLINNPPFYGKSFFTREEYWGNGYHHADDSYERYYDAITGASYGKWLYGFMGYGLPKRTNPKSTSQNL